MRTRGIRTRIASLFVVASSFGTLPVDASEAAVLESPVLERIVRTGQLRIGMSGEQAPFNAVSKSGELIGFEVDLANMVAETLGVEVVFVQKPFPDLLPALESGEVDIVMSGMGITAARSLKAVFVGPYMMSGKSILTNDAELASAIRAEDLNRADLRVAALRNSTSQAFAEKSLPSATLVTTEHYEQAIQMVIRDEVDALVADMPACVLAIHRYPDSGLMALSAPLTVEPIGIAVPATELALQSLLQNYVKAYEDQGFLELLQVEWLETGDWVDQLR